MRWTRKATVALVVALLVATALCAQMATGQQPAQHDVNPAVIAAFAATWIGLLITILGFVLTLRRDRLNWQDRVDVRTKEVLRAELTSREFCDGRDERIREIVSLEYDMKVATVQGELSQLSSRVDALSRRVASVPEEIRGDIRRAVQDGVSDATKRLTEQQLQSTMVMPSRNG